LPDLLLSRIGCRVTYLARNLGLGHKGPWSPQFDRFDDDSHRRSSRTPHPL